MFTWYLVGPVLSKVLKLHLWPTILVVQSMYIKLQICIDFFLYPPPQKKNIYIYRYVEKIFNMTIILATALWPLHFKYRTILTSCCSVWNMNWQWETEWVSKRARVPAFPPGCSCSPTSAPPSLTEPHKWQLQLASVTTTPKIDGQVFLMETVTWSDFHSP